MVTFVPPLGDPLEGSRLVASSDLSKVVKFSDSGK